KSKKYVKLNPGETLGPSGKVSWCGKGDCKLLSIAMGTLLHCGASVTRSLKQH
ncbi:unnamed protein product, partial [Closterium sp. NIES-54]